MARIRTIKPEFWTDEDMATVSETAKLLAIGLLNQSDDDGWFTLNPMLIKAAIFPLCETSVTIHCALIELSNIGYIQCFECSSGKKFGKVKNFELHQKINRKTESKISKLTTLTEFSLINHEQLTTGKERNRERNMEVERIEDLAPSEKKLALAPVVDESPIMFYLPLNTGDCFEIRADQFEMWTVLYPAVNVDQEIRSMIGWLDANPKNRKTRAGVLRFCNNWLSRAQNSSKPVQRQSSDQDWHHDLGM